MNLFSSSYNNIDPYQFQFTANSIVNYAFSMTVVNLIIISIWYTLPPNAYFIHNVSHMLGICYFSLCCNIPQISENVRLHSALISVVATISYLTQCAILCIDQQCQYLSRRLQSSSQSILYLSHLSVSQICSIKYGTASLLEQKDFQSTL